MKTKSIPVHEYILPSQPANSSNKQTTLVLAGTLFGIGDILETVSLVSVDPVTYQVLLQSKFLVTALLMRCMSGSDQSLNRGRLVALALIAASLVNFASHAVTATTQTVTTVTGVCFVLGKVLVSCSAAVLADRGMKDRKSLTECLVIMKIPWLFLLLAAVQLEGDKSGVCVRVFASYFVKGWLTLTLLKWMDSVTKNLGEGVSVLVTFLLTKPTMHSVLPLSLVILALLNHECLVRKRTN